MKTLPKLTKIVRTKHGLIVILFSFAAFATAILLASNISSQRSVASYCSVYYEENSKLASSQGDTYGVSVFTHKSADAADFASAFGRLEKVAPEDISDDVSSLRSIFIDIDKDPSRALQVSLAGMPAQESVRKWTTDHCTIN